MVYNIDSFSVIVVRARLAQSVEHQTFNLRVMGSSPHNGRCLPFVVFSCNLSTYCVDQSLQYKPNVCNMASWLSWLLCLSYIQKISGRFIIFVFLLLLFVISEFIVSQSRVFLLAKAGMWRRVLVGKAPV